MQHAVDPLKGVIHNHGVLALEHDPGEGEGNHRRDDDVEEQVQQEGLVSPALGQSQAAGDEEGKHPVDGSGVPQHGGPELLGVGDDPHPVPVDGILELPEGVDGLAEGLHHRDASDILHRLVGHVVQGVLVLLHLLLHPCTGHPHHDEKAQGYRHQAQQPQPPVKDEEEHQQPARGGNGPCPVGKLVGQIGLCGSAGLVDDFPQLSAAEGLRQAQGKGDDVLHGLDTQVRGHPEGPHVGAHQPCNIHQHRQH